MTGIYDFLIKSSNVIKSDSFSYKRLSFSIIILYNNSLFLFNISDNDENMLLILHWHNTFLVSLLYPLKEQFFSHKDKLLLLKSFILSFNILSFSQSVLFWQVLSL